MTNIFGHRGAAGTFPENTMISFQETERIGANGIELDVQLSRDGEVVVIHDETLERTTNGKGWVKDFTLKELRKLDASYKFPEYGHCKIPTLEELFSWALSNTMIINVELKNTKIPYKGLEEKVINLIKKYSFESRTIISSFNHYSLVKCKKLASEIEVGILFGDGLYEPWYYAKRIGVNSLHPYYKAIPKEAIVHSQTEGFPIRPYTVNNKKDMEQLFLIGCSAIITDYPEIALSLRGKKNRPI
jgi:glycerophosphoryl diester phosphodiesterase